MNNKINIAVIFVFCLFWCVSCGEEQPVSWEAKKYHTSTLLQKPTDLIRFQGRWVACELKNHRLAVFSDFSFTDVTYLSGKERKRRFRAPHFLAISPTGSLLVSNGWGKSIVSVDSLDGAGWREFKGDELGFNAPHGICVDDDGWIYVGDSLNSRIVRFKDMEGKDWQVFKDVEKRVAYVRQLVCKDGAVWAANSYESRKGLNAGTGANVLKITDFVSGESEVVYELIHKRNNITGINIVGSQLFVSKWRGSNSITVFNLQKGKDEEIAGSRNDLGIPYGLFYDEKSKSLICSYFGDFKKNNGGLVLFR